MSAREEPSVPSVKLTEEQLNALSAAGNRALNDHYHDDLCHCRVWPESCVTRGYSPGLWDTGAFDIGLGAVLGLWESMRTDVAAEELSALRARVAELEAVAAQVAEFCADRASYITSIRNCHPDNAHDYNRWQGHAESRRQLSELLGLPVAWPAEVKPQPQAEDPHDSVLHHDYALGRDLPVIPRQTTGRCPDCRGTFEDCTCGGAA